MVAGAHGHGAEGEGLHGCNLVFPRTRNSMSLGTSFGPCQVMAGLRPAPSSPFKPLLQTEHHHPAIGDLMRRVDDALSSSLLLLRLLPGRDDRHRDGEKLSPAHPRPRQARTRLLSKDGAVLV